MATAVVQRQDPKQLREERGSLSLSLLKHLITSQSIFTGEEAGAEAGQEAGGGAGAEAILLFLVTCSVYFLLRSTTTYPGMALPTSVTSQQDAYRLTYRPILWWQMSQDSFFPGDSPPVELA